MTSQVYESCVSICTEIIDVNQKISERVQETHKQFLETIKNNNLHLKPKNRNLNSDINMEEDINRIAEDSEDSILEKVKEKIIAEETDDIYNKDKWKKIETVCGGNEYFSQDKIYLRTKEVPKFIKKEDIPKIKENENTKIIKQLEESKQTKNDSIPSQEEEIKFLKKKRNKMVEESSDSESADVPDII
jgi:hypothetical protein